MASIQDTKAILLRLTLSELERIAPAIPERYWWAEGRSRADAAHQASYDPFKDRPTEEPANRAFWRGVLEGSLRFKFNHSNARGAAFGEITGSNAFRWFLLSALYADLPHWDREPGNDNTAISTCSTSSTMLGSKQVRKLVGALWPTGDEFAAKMSFRSSIEDIKAYSPNNAEERRRRKAKILGIPMATIESTITPDLGPRPDFSMYRPDFEETECVGNCQKTDAVLATGMPRMSRKRRS